MSLKCYLQNYFGSCSLCPRSGLPMCRGCWKGVVLFPFWKSESDKLLRPSFDSYICRGADALLIPLQTHPLKVAFPLPNRVSLRAQERGLWKQKCLGREEEQKDKGHAKVVRNWSNLANSSPMVVRGEQRNIRIEKLGASFRQSLVLSK